MLSTLLNRYFKLCLAGRKDDLLLKFPELKEEIEYLSNRDPSNNLKYLAWQIKLLKLGLDKDSIVSLTSLFDKYKNSPKITNKDHNYYNSLDKIQELKDVFVNESEVSNPRLTKKNLKDIPEEDYELMSYFVDNYTNIKTKDVLWAIKMVKLGIEKEIVLEFIKAFYQNINSNLIKNKQLSEYDVTQFLQLKTELFKKEKIDSSKIIEDSLSCENKIIYKDDDISVRLVSNKKGSVHFGKDTSWCIRLPDQDYFERYTANNIVFFIINTKLDAPWNRIAVSVPRTFRNEAITNRIQYFTSDDTLHESIDKSILDKVEDIINMTAEQQPKSIIAKIKSNEGTQDDHMKLFKLALMENEKNVKELYFDLLGESTKCPVDILKYIAFSNDSSEQQLFNAGYALTKTKDQEIIKNLIIKYCGKGDFSAMATDFLDYIDDDKILQEIVGQCQQSNKFIEEVFDKILMYDKIELYFDCLKLLNKKSYMKRLSIGKLLDEKDIKNPYIIRRLLKEHSELEDFVLEKVQDRLIEDGLSEEEIGKYLSMLH